VSELSDVGAIEVLGARVPSLLTRRVLTTLELQDGQTFALAGLLNRSTNARTTRVPGLGSLPIIGTLFRSVRYSHGETELVVLVTAELVEPQSVAMTDLPFPGVTYRAPNDWEIYVRGRIEGAPPRMSEVQSERMQEMGLDRLRGPGAWASYERAPEQSRSRRGR
jgi:pilus assembly protein CpaC